MVGVAFVVLAVSSAPLDTSDGEVESAWWRFKRLSAQLLVHTRSLSTPSPVHNVSSGEAERAQTEEAIHQRFADDLQQIFELHKMFSDEAAV